MIAITPMEPELGTAWPPPPAPGLTSAPPNETGTSLEQKKYSVTTICFPVLIAEKYTIMSDLILTKQTLNFLFKLHHPGGAISKPKTRGTKLS